MTDEQAELSRARGGDRQAIEALLERWEPRILRFASALCRGGGDAEDVLQETMAQAARSLPTFRGEASLSSWLFAIARSFCARRRRRVQPPSEPLDSEAGRALVDPARLPDEEAAGRQVAVALERAIAELEPGQREVLLLRDVEGLSAPEVAEAIGLSVEAVKSRLHRARLAVRRALEPLVEEPGGACPEVLDLLSRHLEGEIDAAACKEMERHVASCARCTRACDSLRRTLALCHAAAPSPVPESTRRLVREAIRAVLI